MIHYSFNFNNLTAATVKERSYTINTIFIQFTVNGMTGRKEIALKHAEGGLDTIQGIRKQMLNTVVMIVRDHALRRLAATYRNAQVSLFVGDLLMKSVSLLY